MSLMLFLEVSRLLASVDALMKVLHTFRIASLRRLTLEQGNVCRAGAAGAVLQHDAAAPTARRQPPTRPICIVIGRYSTPHHSPLTPPTLRVLVYLIPSGSSSRWRQVQTVLSMMIVVSLYLICCLCIIFFFPLTNCTISSAHTQ